jgi:hypothetical protein
MPTIESTPTFMEATWAAMETTPATMHVSRCREGLNACASGHYHRQSQRAQSRRFHVALLSGKLPGHVAVKHALLLALGATAVRGSV